jgi:hypothetical protein
MDERMVRNMMKLLSSLTPEQLEMSSHLMEKLQFALDPISNEISSFFTSRSSSNSSSAVAADKKVEMRQSHEMSAKGVTMALHTTQGRSQEVPIRITAAQRLPEPKSSPSVAATVKKTIASTSTTYYPTVEKPTRQHLVEKPSGGHNRKMF